MERFYFITYDYSKSGVPAYLEAGLYDKFINKEEYIKNTPLPSYDAKFTPEWRRTSMLNDSLQMPSKLYLINKHRKIDFDIYAKEGGFIISNDFKKIIDSFGHPKYISSPLEIRTREGVCNANKEYWYIKIIEPSPCVDFTYSKVKIHDNTKMNVQPRIDEYLGELYLKSDLFMSKDCFFIDNVYLNMYLFCNGDTYDKIMNSKIRTIKLLEIETFF